ncbi:MAG: hypothetical protein HC802_15940 [Caldilineaceae bacterium]|nr:hypothetical protein [Caldilineaceae bacterium]
MTDVAMLSETTGWITGGHGPLRLDNGVWDFVESGLTSGDSPDFLDAVTESNVWGVGYDGIFHFNGTS